MDEIRWETHRIRMFGREVDSPRRSCWIGDPSTSYVYSRTRFEPRPGGARYAAVTLPNLIVGTVGGGTRLPSQRACLDLLGLAGAGHARAFAEVAAAVALAGELSITGALTAGEFTRSHQRLARAVPAGAVAR